MLSKKLWLLDFTCRRMRFDHYPKARCKRKLIMWVSAVPKRSTATAAEAKPKMIHYTVGATTKHTVRAPCRPPWVFAGTFGIIIPRVPVLTPFLHISVHIVQPPRIWPLSSDSVVASVAVVLMPRYTVQRCFVISTVVARVRAGSTRIFPLGLSGKTNDEPLQFRHAHTKANGILPGYIHNGELRALQTTGIALHDGLVRLLCDLGRTHVERSCDSNCMAGSFISITIPLAIRASHTEFTRRNSDKFHS